LTSKQAVITNAGPLIALGKLNRLDLLAALYPEVIMPYAVYEEVVVKGLMRGAPDASAVRLFWQQQGWPVMEVPREVLSSFAPSVILGPGESEVIALAQTFDNPLVLIDDELARSEARRLKLRVRGTLGILASAYKQRFLSFREVEFLIQEVASRPDIWISARLCNKVLDSLRKA